MTKKSDCQDIRVPGPSEIVDDVEAQFALLSFLCSSLSL